MFVSFLTRFVVALGIAPSDLELQLTSRAAFTTFERRYESDQTTLVASQQDLDDSSFGDSDTVVAENFGPGGSLASKESDIAAQDHGLKDIHPAEFETGVKLPLTLARDPASSAGAGAIRGAFLQHDGHQSFIDVIGSPLNNAFEDHLDQIQYFAGIGSQFWGSGGEEHLYPAAAEHSLHLE